MGIVVTSLPVSNSQRRMLWASLILLAILASACSQPVKAQLKPNYDNIRSERQFWQLVNNASAQEFHRQFEAEFLLIIPDSSREAFNRIASLEKRKKFMRNYWRSMDPDPARRQNAALLEHLRRRNFARNYFSASDPPFYDDRGKIYMRFGPPTDRLKDPGGTRFVGGLVQPGDNQYSVHASETWSYSHIWPDFVVYFVRRGQFYRQVKDLADLIMQKSRKTYFLWYWRDLLRERAWLAPVLSAADNKMMEIELELLRNSGGTVQLGRGGKVDLAVSSDAQNIAQRVRQKNQNALRQAPSEYFDESLFGNALKFSFETAQFREKEGQTRLEIVLGFSPDRLKKQSRHLSAGENFRFSLLVRSVRLDSLAFGVTEREILPSALRAAQRFGISALLSFVIPPQRTELGLDVLNFYTLRRGFSRKPLEVRTFNPNRIEISDIEFFLNAEGLPAGFTRETVVRESRILLPLLADWIPRDSKPVTYLEIYNLDRLGKGAPYQVDYTISRFAGKKRLIEEMAVSNSFTVDEETRRSLLQLDLSSLTPGNYRLDVTVSSKERPGMTVETHKTFRLVP